MDEYIPFLDMFSAYEPDADGYAYLCNAKVIAADVDAERRRADLTLRSVTYIPMKQLQYARQHERQSKAQQFRHKRAGAHVHFVLFFCPFNFHPVPSCKFFAYILLYSVCLRCQGKRLSLPTAKAPQPQNCSRGA